MNYGNKYQIGQKVYFVSEGEANKHILSKLKLEDRK